MNGLFKIVIFFFLYLTTLVVLSQNNVLIIDYNNGFSSDQFNNNSIIYNRLVATQSSVTRISSIPSVISTAYDEVWIFGNMGLTTASNLNPVVNYINSGGAVYVQSEVSCCNNEAAFADNIINAVTIMGASITHNITKAGYYEYTPNPTVYCNSWTSSHGAWARPFVGTPPANILFEANNTCGGSITTGDVIGVKFSSCDMISGKGAFISNGDFNIFPTSGTCTWVGILGGINNFNTIDLIANTFDSLLICSSGCNPLPIELLSFDGENINTGNRMYWTTASEINNDYFTLERSSNSIDFEPIKKIPGAGNSNSIINYSYTDIKPLNGINYYRLKQTDYDGAFSYSKIISIENNTNTELKIYPNPAKNSFKILGVTSPFNLKIVDLLGNILYETTDEYEIINNNLVAGTYIVIVSNENKIYRKKLIIEY